GRGREDLRPSPLAPQMVGQRLGSACVAMAAQRITVPGQREAGAFQRDAHANRTLVGPAVAARRAVAWIGVTKGSEADGHVRMVGQLGRPGSTIRIRRGLEPLLEQRELPDQALDLLVQGCLAGLALALERPALGLEQRPDRPTLGPDIVQVRAVAGPE